MNFLVCDAHPSHNEAPKDADLRTRTTVLQAGMSEDCIPEARVRADRARPQKQSLINKTSSMPPNIQLN
jgi:hypothetical protein